MKAKKAISLFLALVMAMSCMSLGAFAEGTTTQEDGSVASVTKQNGPTTFYSDLHEALEAAHAAAAGGWDTTSVKVEILKDITFNDDDTWTPVTFDQLNPIVIEGHNKKITKLPDMLYQKSGSGVSTLTINDLSFVNPKTTDRCFNAVIMGYFDSGRGLTFNNVSISGATVNAIKDGDYKGYAGAFVGYTGGYNKQNDGPVYQQIVFTGCQVTDSVIIATQGGSAGALMGHAAGNAATHITVSNTTVTGNTVTSTASDKAGALFGTLGVCGADDNYPDAAAYICANVGENTVSSNNYMIGRIGSSGGTCYFTEGGSYTVNPTLTSDPEKGTIAAAVGFEAKQLPEGTWTIAKAVSNVAEIGTTPYATLEAAFAAAVDGDTITVLSNCSGNGIQVPQGKFNTTGLTVDFNGHTYTMDGEMVGSPGTKTQAFQLLKDNKITFQNGTIYSEKAKMLVQNYSDLTLDGMTLTLNNQSYAYAYTLSNNNGDVVIKDTTINANPAGGFAFDVCRYASYLSVNVTVKGNSTINGNVEISASSSDAKDGFSLTLTSGTMTGNIVMDTTAAAAMEAAPEKAIITKGAAFTKDAPAGYKWDATGKLVAVDYVAKIGEDKYTDLQSAFDAAESGATITLLTNVTINGRVSVNGTMTEPLDKAVTLNLSGCNIDGTGRLTLCGGSLNITGSGTISTSASGVAPVEIRYSGDLTAKRTLTIGSGVTLSGTCYGLNIFGSNTNVKNSIDVTVNGTVNGMLFVLGNLKNTANEINVVVNGKISAPAATSGSPNPGIALNGYADVTVNNSASVTGDSGIEVRAGRLTVNGGTITGTASPTSVNANGSGTTSAGAGVAVAQHTTKLPITVTINGARLKGYTGLAISNPEKNNDGGAISVSMTNTNVVLNNGGTKEVSFIADASGAGAETRYGVTWDANDAISKIGTPAGYKVKTVKTTYMIEPIGDETALASIGTKTYPTLAKAVAEAQNGDTITLLNKNVLGATVEFSGKTLTLDLNGNNIEATDLRALHIKSGSVSIIGSGTIKTTHVEGVNFSSSSSVIRVGDSNPTAVAASLTIGPRVTVSSNYCYGVTVFGENVANNAGYGQTLVVNGTVSVTGAASAISGNGSSNYSAVSTTINDGATVTAKADCAIYHPQAGKLAINGGTISGPTAIEIKAGQANVATSEVIVTGTPVITATGTKNHEPNSNGPSTCGYALAAVENKDYKGGVAISIAKGVFTRGEVAIEVDSPSTSHPTISITGGTFFNNVNEYCASGYAAAELTASTASAGEQVGWYKVGVVETTKATATLDGITDSSSAQEVVAAITAQVKSDTESVSFNVQTSIKDEEADKTLDTTTESTVQLKKTKVETVETKQTVVTAGKLEGEKKAIAAVTLDQIKPGKLQEVLENAVASAGAKSSQVHTVDVAIVKDSEAGTMIREGDKVTKQSFEIHAEATAYVTTTNEQTTEKTTEAVGSYILPNSALKEGAQWSFNLPVHPDLVRVWNTGTNGVQYTTQLNHIETNETTGEETTTSKRLTVYANATDGYYTTIDNNSTYSTFELVLDELGGDDPTETPMGSASYGATLSLEDSVYINFYMTDVKDPNGNTADETELAKFKVVYSYNGVETEKTITNAYSNHFVVATCAAKQLADNVSIKVYYNTQLIKDVNYSARTYCENKIKNSDDAKLKSLCYALLEYGAYAQTRFDHNTGDLANKTYNIDAVPATVIDSEYNIAQGTGNNSAVLSTGATLSLESATQINFYVTPASGYTASDITISVKDANDNNVDNALWAAQTLGDGRVWVKITGIAAKNLNAAYKLVLGGGNGTRTVTYSAMSYAYRMRNSADESSICKALNNYHLAAYAYFNH